MTTNHRRFFAAVAAGVADSALPGIALATTPRQAVVAAAWRGPNPGDPCFAGAMVADWETRKLDEWDTHGIDPHPLALDAAGPLIVANGGAPRTLADQKYDLQHMESSLVRLDTASGSLLEFG